MNLKVLHAHTPVGLFDLCSGLAAAVRLDFAWQKRTGNVMGEVVNLELRSVCCLALFFIEINGEQNPI